MINVKEWTTDTTYYPDDVVLMFDKLYISLGINKDIIPIPVVEYFGVSIEGSNEMVRSSNLDSILIIARSLYPGKTDEYLISHHINKNSWIAVQ